MKNNNFDSTKAANNNNSINGGIAMTTINSMGVFAATVKEAVEASLGDGYEVSIHEVLKNNNDTHLTGLTIRTEESNVAPTIYLEGSFERYKDGDATVPVIVSEIISVYESHKVTMPFDASMVTDFSACQSKLCYKLVNADRNKELLSDAPHIIVCDDLAVLFYILVSNDAEGGTATITVRNNMSDLWGVSADELFKIALVNTQRLFRGTVKSMASVMMELLADRLDEEGCREFYDMAVSENDVPMYVCTNTSKINGAGVILYENLLKDFAQKVGTDFYILPSSVHETLLIPVSDQFDVDTLRAMVCEVNMTQVAPEEQLSDQVYLYSRECDQIRIA